MRKIVSDAAIGINADKGRRPPMTRRIRKKVKEILTTSNLHNMLARRERGADNPLQPEPRQPARPDKDPIGADSERKIAVPQPTEVAMWVVIPTRNRPDEFQRCLDRVLAELGPRDHVVAVASGFRMFKHVQKASLHPRVTGLLVGDATVNTARREANKIVPEDSVVVDIGDNDYIRPDALDRMREIFEDPSIGVVYGNVQFIDPAGNPKGKPVKKTAWEKGVMHRRCEVRGLHAYRKSVYTRYGGWYESEIPAGDHANAIRWEDAGVKFACVGGKPLVDCTWDKRGMSASQRTTQHINSQTFSGGEYRRKIDVAMVCWSMAGRRTKMLGLIDKICDPENVKIYASNRGRYGTACDVDDDIRRRIVWWASMGDLSEWLKAHQVCHLFVDRMDFALQSHVIDRRVVVDVCDLRTQRTGEHGYDDERKLCTSPNVYLMFVSEGHRDYICEKYDMPVERTHIVPNLPMKSWRPEEPLKEKERVPNSLVYFGGITARKNHVAAYRYYHDIFKALKDAGVDVHIFPSGGRIKEVKEGYKEFTVHDRFAHRDIYDVLRRFSVGFAGYEDRAGCPDVSHSYAMKCYPNKATDYMMAGIPTLSYALGLAEKDVKNWGVCVPKGDAKRIVDAYFEAKGKEIDFERWQNEFCMENQAQKILDAYDWVMGRK